MWSKAQTTGKHHGLLSHLSHTCEFVDDLKNKNLLDALLIRVLGFKERSSRAQMIGVWERCGPTRHPVYMRLAVLLVALTS